MTLEELIEWARTYQPTEAEIRDQIISFAYGNVAIENPTVTRKMVADMYDTIYSIGLPGEAAE